MESDNLMEIRIPPTHLLDICISTTGEECLFDCLDRVIQFTPEVFEIKLWYNVIGEYDEKFVKRALNYSPDLIVSYKGRGCTEEAWFHQLDSDAEFLLGMCADTNVNPNYFERLMEPMRSRPTVGWTAAGCPIQDEHSMHVVPDKIGIIRKAVINQCGAFTPMFRIYGHHCLEYLHRIRRMGWEVVVLEGLIGPDLPHTKGTKLEPEHEHRTKVNGAICAELFRRNHEDFLWWNNSYKHFTKDCPIDF